MIRGIDQVHTENAHSFLLLYIAGGPRIHVQNHVVGCSARLLQVTQSRPSLAVVCSRIVPGRDGIYNLVDRARHPIAGSYFVAHCDSVKRRSSLETHGGLCPMPQRDGKRMLGSLLPKSVPSCETMNLIMDSLDLSEDPPFFKVHSYECE